MVVDEPNANVNNIMSGIENTGGVLHNRKKLRQRFDIIKKLGQGTYGKVQLGINKETGQEVAIKTIKKCKIESSADLVRIRREVQIMSSVRHPNIIHIYEVFENREKMVLVMEYAAGGELYDYLSTRKVLPEEEARRIFRQIATAIYYCHKHKICHRDLKLENILLDEHGSAKIADFGLSNVFAEQRTLSTYCGSPLYASPEIVTGTPYNGPEVDCWSLGVLLYTMVYGAMPFDGTHFKTLVKQISQGDYFEPKKKSPASSLIKDMLTVSSKERADVERICAHWWVNEGYEHSCLDIAEELASQTPVRLDLLLSLNPQTVDSEKLVVTEEQVAATEASEALDNTAPMLTRSQSADSVMDVQLNCAQVDNDVVAGGDHAIKPSSTKIITPSVDIVEEPRPSSTKRKLDDMESADKSNQSLQTKKEEVKNETIADRETCDTGVKPKKDEKPSDEKRKSAKRKVPLSNANHVTEDKNNIAQTKPDTKDDGTTKIKPRIIKKKVVAKPDDIETVETDENASNNIQKPKERRKSRILEAAEKFNTPNNIAQTGSTKKIFIPGVSVGEHRQQFERRASLNSTTPPLLERKGSLLIDSSAPTTPDTNGSQRPYKRNQTELQACVAQSENVLQSIEKLMNHLNMENEDSLNTSASVNNGSMCSNETSTPKSSPSMDGKALPLSLSLEDARKSLEHSISLINEEKKISDKELHKKMAASNDKSKDVLTKEQQMKHAVETISNAIPRMCIGRKPPVPYGAFGRSSSMGPSIGTLEKLRIQSPIDKFNYNQQQDQSNNTQEQLGAESPTSATLPRRKVSTAEIKLRKPDPKADPGRLSFKNPLTPMTFRTEVEHKVGDLRSAPVRPDNGMWGMSTQSTTRAASLEPEKRAMKERIVPIQVQADIPKTPSYQRTTSVKSNSLSRQNTDSDGESTAASTITGAEPIRKSAREVIIPIAVEGGGYVTPRAASLEPSEGQSRSSRSGRTSRRMNSLLSDNSGDESTFGRLHRHSSIGRDSDGEDSRFHLHRLRSSRPTRGLIEPSDSVSSGEDDDDEDGFELLTAENLFSTLLSRVRSLTQRHPRSSLLAGHTPFWERDPLARRLNSGLGQPSWRRSTSRDSDRTFGSPDWSTNNTLPRGRKSKKHNQDSSKIPAANNNNITNDPSSLELDLADLDLSRLKLSQSELDALTNLTPNLSERLQNQLLSQLPPTQARKLSRNLSLRLPKTSSNLTADTLENSVSSNKINDKSEDTATKLQPVETDHHRKSQILRNNVRSMSEISNDISSTSYENSEIPRYSFQNNSRATPDRSVLSKYLPLQKGQSLTDSTSDSVKVLKQPSQRRISRFLRPDFFDTPRDESCYAKQKRERELETQQVLKEIRGKRDMSTDRSNSESTRKNIINTSKDICAKPILQTLYTETAESENDKSTTECVKSDIKSKKSLSISNSKIARPKSLIINSLKSDISNTCDLETETDIKVKTPVKSKLPTNQNRRDSKLLRPKSYPSSTFSSGNDTDVPAKKVENKIDNSDEPHIEPAKSTDRNEDQNQVENISKTTNGKATDSTEVIKKSPDTSSFLQSIGQTLDKLRGETKFKSSKKTSKELNGSSTKASSKQSTLKSLKRKSTGNSDKKNNSHSEVSSSSVKAEDVINDSIPSTELIDNSSTGLNNAKMLNKNLNADETQPESTNNEIPSDVQNSSANNSTVTETKSERKSRIENVIKSLRERSIPRGPMAFTESGLIKRAVSVEDVTGHLKPSRRSVSKVLDLFNKIENTTADTVRKKDEDINLNSKSKSKIKGGETSLPERPKSLIITNNSNPKTMPFRECTDTNDQIKISPTNNSPDTTQSKPNDFINNRKPTSLKLDFSKLNSYRKSLEKTSSENSNIKSSDSTYSDAVHQVFDNNHSKDHTCADASDISSATTCLSPNYEAELAFDDWSVCSDSIIHKNNHLGSTYSDVSPNFDTYSEMEHNLDHSHTGPRSHYNHSALENSDSESIIDRIKRKSYYLRFNEKKQKRKSSLVGPGAKDYYSSPVFDGIRASSKPTSPLNSVPDSSFLMKYRPKMDLSKPMLDYGSSSGIKRRESCSAFDYRHSNSNTVHGRSYSSLDTRTPHTYARSYSNYSDASKRTTNHMNGICGDYSASIHSSKDNLYNRDYLNHLSKDYADPKLSPYSRRSYIGNYHTYNPSLQYSFESSSKPESHSAHLTEQSIHTPKYRASPQANSKED